MHVPCPTWQEGGDLAGVELTCPTPTGYPCTVPAQGRYTGTQGLRVPSLPRVGTRPPCAVPAQGGYTGTQGVRAAIPTQGGRVHGHPGSPWWSSGLLSQAGSKQVDVGTKRSAS